MTPGARIPLSEADAKKLADLLESELDEALRAHADKEERLAAWDQLYLAQPKQAKKTFPWDGACNVVLPLIGTTVDSIVARIVNTIFSVEPFWTVRPLHRDFRDLAKPTEDFLDWSRRVEFDLYKPVKSWTIEVVKYGWGWLKPRWDIDTRPYFKPLPNGEVAREDITQRRAVVDHVLAQDIVSQAGIADERCAEWIAHRVRLTDGALRWKVAQKVYPVTDTELEQILDQKEDAHQARENLEVSETGSVGREKLNTIYEVWGDLPIGKDPKPIPVVITFHRPTRTILRAIYNPHFYGFRPFLKGTFIEREGRSEGLGIAQMLSQLQDEMSTIHCQQVDNATLANTRFFLGKRGAIRPNTRIWPGRVLTVGDPNNDLKAFQLGDTYSSMRALEVSVMSFAERRSGVSDPQLGRESSVLGSRATATGTLALIQEGNRRFDLNVRDMRNALSECGKTVLQLNQQFRPKGIAYFVQGEDGLLTEATLDLPSEWIERRLGVELTASTATINREVEKQGLIALMQLQQQYGQELLSYAQIVTDPQMPGGLKEMAMKVSTARTELMQRVMHAFDQKDPDNLAPAMAALEDLNALPPDVGGFGAGAPMDGMGAGGPGGGGAGDVGAEQLAPAAGLAAGPAGGEAFPPPGGGQLG